MGELIDNVRAVEFDFIPAYGGQHEYGVIAQELLKYLPPEQTVVQTGNDGYYRVDYIQLIPILLGEVQRLKTRVKDLRS